MSRSGAFDDQFQDAAPPPGQEPVKITATPYVWRDPETIPRRPWIYGRIAMRGQVGGKFAPGAAGKTTHEIATALAMATGRDFMGHRVWDGPKTVWLWNLEDSGEEIARIIQATCKHWGITEADIGGRLYVDSALDGAILKIASQNAATGVVIHEPVVDALLAEILARKVDYLSIDPFISSHSVEENDNGAIDAVVKKYAMVATRGSCAINLTHHVTKVGSQEVTSLSARGASSMVAALRSGLVLNRMSPDEAERWGIGAEDRRRYFRVYDDKNNRAPPAEKSDWYRLISVDLGNGDQEAHAPPDSIGVVEPWVPPDAFENVTLDTLNAVQTIVAERMNGPKRAREHYTAKWWVGKIIAEVMDLDAEGPKDRKKINSIMRQWISNGALVKVDGKDDRGEDRVFIEVGHWAYDTSGPAVTTAEVRGGAGGAGTKAVSAPAPPFIGGAEVRNPAAASAGGDNDWLRGKTKGLPGSFDDADDPDDPANQFDRRR